jgi:hypothetical protein
MSRFADQLPIVTEPTAANFLLGTDENDPKALVRIPVDFIPAELPIDWENAEIGKSLKWDGEKFVFFCLPLLVLGEVAGLLWA